MAYLRLGMKLTKKTHVTERRRYIREQYASDNKQEFINN